MSNLDGIVRIGVDVQDQQATDAPNSLAQNFKRAFKLIGAVMAAFTAKNFINQTIQMAESARILNRTLTNTFGENYDVARERMNGIANQFGMVNGRLDKEFATFSRSWLQMGYDIEQSMDLAERQMRVAQNAAVGLGYEFDYTSERAKSFIAGNYQAGVRLGAFATRADVAAWAMDNYGINMDDATAAQQKMMRLRFLEYMQELGKMSDYYNQGARDMANVQANINHEVERFQAIIGGLFLDTKVDMMINMVDALVWFNDILEGSNSIMDVAIGMWNGMSHTMQDVTIAFGIFSLAIAAFNFDRIIIGAFDMMLAFEAKAKAMLLAAKNSKILSGAMAFLKSPFGIVAVAITAVVLTVRLLYRNFEWFRDLVHGIMPAIQNVITTTGNAISNVIYGIINGFENLGGLGQIIDGFIGNIKNLGGAFLSLVRDADPTLLLENLHKLIPMALKILIGGKPALLMGGIQLIANIADGMGKTIPELIEKVTGIIVGMIEKFGEWLPKFITTGLEILESIVQGILYAIPQVVESTVKVVNSLVETVSELLPVLLETGIEILTELINGIIETVPVLLETGMELITSLLETIAETLPLLLETGVELLLALVDGILEVLPVLIDSAITIIASLVSTFFDLLPQLIDSGIAILNALIDGIQRIKATLISTALSLMADFIAAIAGRIFGVDEEGQNAIRAFINGVGTFISDAILMGSDVVQGLIDGMGAMLSNVGEMAANVGRAALNGVRNFLGINSPSREMLKLGESTAQGLSRGLDGNSHAVEASVRQMTQMMNDHARQGAEAFLQVFRQMGTNLTNQQRTTVNQITTAMNPLPNNMRNSGVSAMNGLINGMNAQRGAVLNTARNIANEVTRTIQGALRISSPSMVMRDEVGKWIPLGIADGIDKYSDAIDLPKLPSLESQFNIPNVSISRSNNRNNGFSHGSSNSEDSNQNITIEVPLYLNNREIARGIADNVTLEQNNSSSRRRTFRGGLT